MSTFANFTIESIRQMNKAYADALNPDDNSVTIPVILTSPEIYDSKNDTQYVSINPYAPGIINTGFYKDLNKDKSIQKKLSKYYFYKIIDKWMYKELMPLLAFVEINQGKPQLIKSINNFDIQKLSNDSKEDIEKKIKYMEKIIITKDMVRHVLKKICKENNINWYNLDKHEKKIKKIFYNYLLDKLKYAIKKYGIQK